VDEHVASHGLFCCIHHLLLLTFTLTVWQPSRVDNTVRGVVGASVSQPHVPQQNLARQPKREAADSNKVNQSCLLLFVT